MKYPLRPLLPVSFVAFAILAISLLITSQAQSSNTIHGCRKINNGQLRIVSGTGQCNPSEIEISWLQGEAVPLENHHKEIQVTLPVLVEGQQHVFPFPRTDAPVRVEVLVTGTKFTNIDQESNPGQIVVPSALISGLFTYDSSDNMSQMMYDGHLPQGASQFPTVTFRDTYVQSNPSQSQGPPYLVREGVSYNWHGLVDMYLVAEGPNLKFSYVGGSPNHVTDTPNINVVIHMWY